MQKYCKLVENMLDGADDQKENILLPFYNVSQETMQRVKEFLLNFDPFVELPKPVTRDNMDSIFDKDQWQKNFFKNLSDKDLHELVDAVNFMDIPVIFESCCRAIAVIFKKAQIAYSKELGMESEVMNKAFPGDEDKQLQKDYEYIF